MLEAGLLVIKQKLKKCYKLQHKLFPHKPLSKVDTLTLSMLGDFAAPVLHAKGAETRHMLGFVLQELVLHVHELGDSAKWLIDSGMALSRWYQIVDEEARVMSVGVQQDLMDQCLKHGWLSLGAQASFVHPFDKTNN